jgi:hypothetical protein
MNTCRCCCWQFERKVYSIKIASLSENARSTSLVYMNLKEFLKLISKPIILNVKLIVLPGNQNLREKAYYKSTLVNGALKTVQKLT